MKRTKFNLKYLVHVVLEFDPCDLAAVILIDLLHDIVPHCVIFVLLVADESALQFLFSNSAITISVKYIKCCLNVFVV